MKRVKKLKVVYTFDGTIPHWQERLKSAYEMLFYKIIEMEAKNGKKVQAE